MKFRQLSDSQILALAIDEWLMDLGDEEWDEAIRHIEKRKRQRASRKSRKPDPQSFRTKSRRSSISP